MAKDYQLVKPLFKSESFRYKYRRSTKQRGYGSRWVATSKAFLRDNPFCVHCMEKGIVTAAKVTDHIIPFKPGDELHYDWDNFQALCIACHNRKTIADKRNNNK